MPYYRESVRQVQTLLPSDDAGLDAWLADALERNADNEFALLATAAMCSGRVLDARHLAKGAGILNKSHVLDDAVFSMRGEVKKYLFESLVYGRFGQYSVETALGYIAAWCCKHHDWVFSEQLSATRDNYPDIDFFECPNCHRRYARKKGGNLTYCWLHPISLPLYTILFEENPVARAYEIAEAKFPLDDDFTPTRMKQMVDEIDLELEGPTQQVREILGNRQSEAECREFLAAFSLCLKKRLSII